MSWTNLATEIFDKQSSRHQPASAKFSSAPTNVGVVAESMWITSDEFPAMCHGTGSRKEANLRGSIAANAMPLGEDGPW